MDCATVVEPTKLTALTCGCSISASTASLSPWITLKTPRGKAASLNSRAMDRAEGGARSPGLRPKVLPHAIAIGNIQHGTMHGKLNGVMPATTPNGCRKVQ